MLNTTIRKQTQKKRKQDMLPPTNHWR